jgi:hypothetical protein
LIAHLSFKYSILCLSVGCCITEVLCGADNADSNNKFVGLKKINVSNKGKHKNTAEFLICYGCDST